MKERQVEATPMIPSLLWTDLYKITMGQAVLGNYPEVGVKYDFINRGKTHFPEGFDRKLREQLETMAGLSLTDPEITFLQEKCPFLTSKYLDWFKNYHFDPSEVSIEQNGEDLSVEIEGPWKRTIYWEVPLMATISELFFRETGQIPDRDYLERAKRKGDLLRENQAKILEFGTRRSFSTEVHRNVLEALVETAKPIDQGGVLLGTSNVALAKEFDLNPSGTYAHEWVMGHAAMFGYQLANVKAMEVWAKEYLGLDGKTSYPKLGTALPDTFTTDVFLKDFNKFWANYYTNLRQDSGNPFIQVQKIIDHYRKIGIDLKTHGVVPSDGLDTETVIELQKRFGRLTQLIYGIGTHFTNDVRVKPLNIVIKAFSFMLPDGRIIRIPKISDCLGKESGDPEAILECKEALGLAA